MQILLIIWIACRHYFVIKILFQEANFSPTNEGICWNLLSCYFSWPFGFQIVMFWLTYAKSGWIHGQFFFETEVHLPVFRANYSNLEIMWILLIIWIAVMVPWQYFIIKFVFQEANFSPSVKAVVGTCLCAISLDHRDFRLFMFGIYSRNQDEIFVSFILRWKFIILVSEDVVRIWSLANYLDHLECCNSVIVF